MDIIYKDINELKEYDDNPRDNEAAVPKVLESIKMFGFINPIAITEDNTIISGHTRLKAAKLLKMDKVPCIVHKMSDEDAKLARIIDNKSNEYSTWDVFKLQAELESVAIKDTVFFKPCDQDVKARLETLTLSFGNVKMPISEEEYLRFKEIFDNYIKKQSTYLGFITYLLEGKNVQS